MKCTRMCTEICLHEWNFLYEISLGYYLISAHMFHKLHEWMHDCVYTVGIIHIYIYIYIYMYIYLWVHTMLQNIYRVYVQTHLKLIQIRGLQVVFLNMYEIIQALFILFLFFYSKTYSPENKLTTQPKFIESTELCCWLEQNLTGRTFFKSELYALQKRRSTEFEALKMQSIRSGWLTAF